MSVSSSGSSANPASGNSTGFLLSSQGSGTPLQVTGLASGLDTNAIVQELMAIQQQPVTHLQNQVSHVKAGDSQLTGIQTALQTLASNAQALASVSLFQNTQTATSTDSATVAASTTSNVGAVVGGYQIAVSQMATSSQQTFGFTSSPTQTDTVTIGTGANPPAYTLQPGATAQDLVNAVNSDPSGAVWGTVVNGNIVFSDRTTGAASTFNVSDTAGLLTQQSSTGGQDAKFTVNNGAQQTSASNIVTTAIPGVSLTFGGITTTTPVTVSVGPPSISTSAVQTAVQNFVTSYNSVMTQIQTQLSQTPSTSDPTQGTLYQDPELQDLLNNMRTTMYTGGTGLPTGMASMLDLGVSTGATTGSATPSQTAISGQLSLNATTLIQALTSNPSGVTAVLQSFASSFSSMVDAVSGPGGSIDTRVQSDNSQISDLNNQISTMQSALANKQQMLTQEFAKLEAALSQNQSTSSWLTSQINSLPG